jgi:hypothetical protein
VGGSGGWLRRGFGFIGSLMGDRLDGGSRGIDVVCWLKCFGFWSWLLSHNRTLCLWFGSRFGRAELAKEILVFFNTGSDAKGKMSDRDHVESG